MTVLLFTTDLMTSSKVDAAARRQGVTLVTLGSGAALVERAGQGAELVILDLNSPGVDPTDLVPKLRALPTPPRQIIAFGPHVHEAKLAAAQAAGCDAVMPRGQFHAQVDELIAPA